MAAVSLVCAALPQAPPPPRLRAGRRLSRRAVAAAAKAGEGEEASGAGRGLHSFTSQLNLSAFCGIGAAFMGCLGG
jgi:hypothetical protein